MDRLLNSLGRGPECIELYLMDSETVHWKYISFITLYIYHWLDWGPGAEWIVSTNVYRQRTADQTEGHHLIILLSRRNSCTFFCGCDWIRRMTRVVRYLYFHAYDSSWYTVRCFVRKHHTQSIYFGVSA